MILLNNMVVITITIYLQLTDVGVNYDNPQSEEEFDVDMIVTLKQLLMFAVQISYGLVRRYFFSYFYLQCKTFSKNHFFLLLFRSISARKGLFTETLQHVMY